MQYPGKVSYKTARQSSILILIGEGSAGNFQTFLIKCSKFKSVKRLMMNVECFSLAEKNRFNCGQGALLRYLNSIVSKEGLGVRLSCQVEDGRFAPAFCPSHQQSIRPVLAVGIALSKHICHKRTKKLPNLNSHFISICLCWPRCFAAISRRTSRCV